MELQEILCCRRCYENYRKERAVPGIKYLQVLGLSTPSKYLSSNDFTLKKQDASTCKYLTLILLICWP